MLEKEFKYLISAEFYTELMKIIFCDEPQEIINNYYLDSEGLLQNNHVTVRLREKNGEKFFQIKQNLNQHDNIQGFLAIRKEYSCKVDDDENFLEKILFEVKKHTELNVKNLYLAGTLKTIRNQVELGDSTVLCLDKNIYIDIIDYEAEIEFKEKEPSDEAKVFMNLLEENSLNSQGGKRTRFLRRLRQLYQPKII